MKNKISLHRFYILIFVLVLSIISTEMRAQISTDVSILNSTQTTTLNYDFNDTDWYYIAYTKALDGTGHIYVNGVEVSELTWDPSNSYDHFIFNIAANYTFLDFNGFFAGTIDEIKISNTIRTESELKTHFDSDQPFTPDASTLLLFQFDEGSGDKFSDAIDISKKGTLYGVTEGSMPTWVTGKFGNAIMYDGLDDYGQITADLPEYEATYEMWIKFDNGTKATSQTIIQPYGTLSTDFNIVQSVSPMAPVREDVEFYLGSTTGLQGNTVLLPVTAAKFVEIMSMQGTIEWDRNILQYSSVQDFAIADMDISNFNNPETGKLTYSWNSTGSEVTLPNNTILFNIEFLVIGDETSDVVFADIPTPREITDKDLNVIDAVFSDGDVTGIGVVTLGGYLRTQNGEAIVDASVVLSGDDNSETVTDASGWYSFDVLPGQDYTITPSYTTNADDGVTTLDLVTKRWNIMGTKNTLSDYDLIASDVNNDKVLSTLDVAVSRAVILHVTDSFGSRRDVEFINHEYTGTPDAFSFQNYTNINPSVDETALNFTVVKLGDASRNWKPSNSGSRIGNSDLLKIILEPGEIAGRMSTMKLKADKFNDMIGLQFTMTWDPEVYKFSVIQNKHIKLITNEEYINEGKLTALWTSKEKDGVSLENNSLLSAIEFEVLDAYKSADANISSEITPALAFDKDFTEFNVSAEFAPTNELFASELKIFPNPAVDQISILGFDDSDYSILTTTGQLVQKGNLASNSNIYVKDLKKGVYILRLIDDNNSILNKKFIKQ